MNSSEDERLQCMLCDMRSTNLNSHITRTHGVKLDEYRRQFPTAQTCVLTRAQIEKMRQTKQRVGENTRHRHYLDEKCIRAKEFDDVITCRVCSYTSASSLIAHITRKHKLKMVDYRRMYPNDVVQRLSKSMREKVSVTTALAMQRSDVKEKVDEGRSLPSELKHWTRKGYSLEEAAEKVSKHQTTLALRQNNLVTKQKQSENASGEANPMSLTSIARRKGVTLDEASKLTPAYGRTGSAHPMFGKKHTEDALKKISGAWHLTQPKFRSKGEIELANECRKIEDINENSYIAGYNVDIVFHSKKLVIEYFGDMWHMNKTCYSMDDVNPITGVIASKQWKRDNAKLVALCSAGYTVIVVWENDWKYERERVLKEIEDAYNRA